MSRVHVYTTGNDADSARCALDQDVRPHVILVRCRPVRRHGQPKPLGVGDIEPSRAIRRDEGPARRDDLLPHTGLGDPSARADQKGDRIRQITSLGKHRVGSRRTEERPWNRADSLAQAIAFSESFPEPGSAR
jgi:hypothetical protein